MQTAVKNVPFSAPAIDSLIDLQRELKKENYIVSTRKYVQIVTILKAYTYLQEEAEVSEDSFEILNHVIWNHPKEQTQIRKIIAKVGNPVNIQAQEILAAITEKLSDLGTCPTF
ncbi:MAG: hypothetical protein ACK46E_01305, partial [Pseudanabaena sp.]